jgi:hypothetical protein
MALPPPSSTPSSVTVVGMFASANRVLLPMQPDALVMTQVDPYLNVVKGRGGALLREKASIPLVHRT